jgi:hypothetical protein
VKHLVEYVTGETKDPGVALFRRFKSEFFSLALDDQSEFRTLELDSLPSWMQVEARRVLEWALASLYSDTWPRADYNSCLLLLVHVLGGKLKCVVLRYPPPDHHARWMSKVNNHYCFIIITTIIIMDHYHTGVTFSCHSIFIGSHN